MSQLSGGERGTSVVEHHPAVEEGVVAEEVFDLSLAAAVRTVDALHDVSALDRVLLAVQRRRLLVFPLLLEAGRLHGDHLAMHVQHLRVGSGEAQVRPGDPPTWKLSSMLSYM